jgi:hypothetical protein
VLGVFAGHLAVQHRVMLAVVAHEEPRQVRELDGEAPQGSALVLLAGAEPAVLVGPQSVMSMGPSG